MQKKPKSTQETRKKIQTTIEGRRRAAFYFAR